MFEMDDSKIGKLKVYNVTEARANFASVLREKDAKVVITWHGRPSRILVDYQEYAKLLQAQPENLSSEAKPLKIDPAGFTPTVPPGKWSEEDLTQIVKSITESLQGK